MPQKQGSPRPANLLEECVYTCVHSGRLRDSVTNATPITEGKPWVRARQLLEEAKQTDRKLAIVIADARRCVELLFWAHVSAIEVNDDTNETKYRVENVREMDGENTVQDLTLVSTGKPIAPHFIRPYAICRKPSFLLETDPVDWEGEHAEELLGLEGRVRESMVKHRQRERRLRAEKIRTVLAASGALRCEVPGCGFDFHAVYGEIGREFAHVHHRTSLAERGEGLTSLADLAIVCANCHAMIHRSGECRPLEELRPRRG